MVKVTDKTHTAFAVDYVAKGKDILTPINGGNLFNALRGNLGKVIDESLRKHFPQYYADVEGRITVPLASTSDTNPRTGAPVAVHLTDATIGINVTDPDTGDQMLIAAKGLAPEGIPTLLQMIEVDNLEISNRLKLKLTKEQTLPIHEYLDGINELEAQGYIKRKSKPTIRRRSSLVLREIKPSHRSKAVIKEVVKPRKKLPDGLTEAQKDALLDEILGLL